MKHLNQIITAAAIMLATNVIAQNAPPAVNPTELGRSSNIYSSARPQQNQVYANDATGKVVFIHQQDITVWGGGTPENGKLRYDISSDGGASFVNDVGQLNPTYTQRTRHPQIIGVGDSLLWAAPTLSPAGDWDGYASGVVSAEDAPFANPTIVEETYDLQGLSTHLPGGLSQSWTDGTLRDMYMVDVEYADATGFGDEVRLLYTTADDGDFGLLSWIQAQSFTMPYDLTFDGDARVVAPNLAFSPDITHGWIAMLGDLTGGAQHTRNPIFIYSSTSGNSWGTPIEVNLATATFESGGTLADELQDLWVDMNDMPLSTGVPTCGYEFDLTVDADGNPHMLVVVGSASTTDEPGLDYGFEEDLAKLMVDISTNDFGTTWNITKVSPIYTFKGEIGTPDINGDLFEHYHYPQISRTADGSHIFYSWIDSDTTTADGGIGFGESGNIYPNLRIAGKRMADQFMTCPKWITNGDFIWDGRIYLPTMAPEVLTADAGSTFKLPIVFSDMITNDQQSPCRYWYLGNDAVLNSNDFTGSCSGPVSVSDNVAATRPMELYPNPAIDAVTLELPGFSGKAAINLIDATGRTVYSTNISSSKTNIDLSQLSMGVYTLQMLQNGKATIKKLVKQ